MRLSLKKIGLSFGVSFLCIVISAASGWGPCGPGSFWALILMLIGLLGLLITGPLLLFSILRLLIRRVRERLRKSKASI